MTTQRFIVAPALLALLLVGVAPGDIVTIGASKDNTLIETSGSDAAQRSNGGSFGIFVGRTNRFTPTIRRGLIRFDVAGSVPAGATINSAALTLYFEFTTDSSARTHSLRRLLRDWGEGTAAGGGGGGGGDLPGMGDATWAYNFFNTSQWNSPGAGNDGGDRSAVVSASQSVGIFSGPITWGPTAALTADVQFWLDNPAQNFGWLILGMETGTHTARRFSSRESDIPEWRPALMIDYTPVLPPIIDSIPNATTVCGDPYTSAAPTLSQGTPPVTWALLFGPPGMTINPGSGAVGWPNPAAAAAPYTITVEASNAAGSDSMSWLLTVRPGDFNGDGLLTPADVLPFVDVLTGISASTACAADVNLDGFIDGIDVQAFVAGL